MSLKICFAILLLSLVSTRVLDIDDSNYEAITYPHNFTFISFQNDKCPQCAKVKKELEAASEYLDTMNIPVGIVDVNSTKTQTLIQNFTIESLPTLAIIRNNRTIYYHAMFKANAIITFLTKLSKTEMKNITNAEELEALTNPKTNYMTLLSFERNHTYNYNYVDSINKFCTFAFCDTEVCLKKYKKEKTADFVVIKNYELKKEEEESRLVYYNFTNEDDLINAIIKNAIPTVGLFSDFAAEIVYKKQLTAVFLVKTHKGTDSNDEKVLSKVLSQYPKGDFFGFILDSENSDDADTLDFYGFDKKSLEKSNVIFMLSFKNKERGSIYVMEEKINQKSFEKFIDDYNKGSLTRRPRTEGEPVNHPKKNLKVVVGKTFQREILDNSKQVVVVAYITTNNCPKCQNVKDIMNKLSDTYSNKDNILFAFVDPVYNEIAKLPENISGRDLPIIEYYDVDKQVDPIKYKGGFEYEQLEKFVENEGFNEPVVIEEEESNGDL